MALKSQQIIHSFNGALTFDKIEEILHSSKTKLDAMHLELIVKKRVYTVLVECLENTYKHNETENFNKSNQVKLTLSKQNNLFVIDVSNFLNKENLIELTERIEMVNSLNMHELNELYRQSISKARISIKGGAGLGLIEIARNSRQKINYEILQNQEDTNQINLRINIADKAKNNR